MSTPSRSPDIAEAPTSAGADAPDLYDVEIGRRYVFAACALLLLAHLGAVLIYVTRVGTDRLPQQLGRTLTTLALCYFLLRGYTAARWIVVGLCLLGLFTLAGPLLSEGAFRGERLPGTLVLLALFVGYGVIGRGFLYSQSVRAFFRARTLDRAATRRL